MKVLRTPDVRFENLKDYDFQPNYFDVNHEGKKMRMHYSHQDNAHALS